MFKGIFPLFVDIRGVSAVNFLSWAGDKNEVFLLILSDSYLFFPEKSLRTNENWWFRAFSLLLCSVLPRKQLHHAALPKPITTMEKRLFLLDAYALIFRAYYALINSPRVTSTGLNTSAAFGFLNTLLEVLKKENPTHIAVCFDPPGPTFRHEAYEGYKAEREATPEDI